VIDGTIGQQYGVVWRSANYLNTTVFPAAPSETKLTTAPIGCSGLDAGFDAVGDGAGLTGYAVVYYQFDANAPSSSSRCK
jgi:hypothetical protein